jgi:3-methyladenine DNA glycosylase AlkC
MAWQKQPLTFTEWRSAIHDSKLEHHQLSPLLTILEALDKERRKYSNLASKNTVSYNDLMKKIKTFNNYKKEKELIDFMIRTAKRHVITKGE